MIHTSRRNGFTLIEMLVALVIFSALMSVLMLGFKQALFLWDKGQRESVVWQRYLLYYNALDQVFIQSVAANYKAKEGGEIPYFQGDLTRLHLISSAPLLSAPGIIRPVELRWQNVDSSLKLEYREGVRGGDPERGMAMPDEWQVLLSDLKQGSFLFEAPVYDPLDVIDTLTLSGNHPYYRKNSIWLSKYDTHTLKIMPRRVSLLFEDSEGIKHQWRFLLRTSSGAFPESMYMDN
ncbi:MAG: type II secretion system protein [Mariprofundaceae bacterium]|nr:type II secretion system protein [Mariprofundaceae bacterium]